MILDMATRNMDPVSKSIMRSTIGADLLDLDVAGGAGGSQGSFGQSMLNLQRQQQLYQQQQRQRQLLQQQRQQKLAQLELLKRQQQLQQRQRDAANMILAATAVGKAVENRNKATVTSPGFNPYTASNNNKDSLHISVVIANPNDVLQQAAAAARPTMSRLRATGQGQPQRRVTNPANNMMSNVMMMQAMRGLELV